MDVLLLDHKFLKTMEQIFDPVPVPMILVDKDGIVIMINEVFAGYLGRPKEEIMGRHVGETDKNTRFPYVLQKKVPEIAWRHRFENGHTAIVHRIPVMDDEGEVMYGFGMVLFQDLEEFKEIIKRNKQLDSELFHIRNELKRIVGAKYSWDTIVGNSEKMIASKYMGKKASLSKSNVLLLGESGTGKEMFAHAIHNDSGRSFCPFIKVNCAAIPHNLLESELFGYEEGAFTGAKKGGKIGKFELANNGTIFLDEIGDMSMEMQVKLLRVLQEREFERIGGNETIKIDVRVIAATNKNLEQLIGENLFREDLYYRLNVMTISIPPLRERDADIGLLIHAFVEKLSDQMGRHIKGVSDEFMSVMTGYTWPGNVRELENVIERAINMSESDTLDFAHLPIHVGNTRVVRHSGPIRPLKEIVEEVEKQVIAEALKRNDGNKQMTAKQLKIGRSSLYEKMERYQLNN